MYGDIGNRYDFRYLKRKNFVCEREAIPETYEVFCISEIF